MRKIQFNEATINEIRNFINEGHTKREACNRFTLKLDTLNRVMRENNIQAFHSEKISTTTGKRENPETINLICNLFSNTDMRLRDIQKEARVVGYYTIEVYSV